METKTKKAAAGIIAGTVITAAVGTLSMQSDNPKPIIDDIKPVTVQAVSVTVPEVGALTDNLDTLEGLTLVGAVDQGSSADPCITIQSIDPNAGTGITRVTVDDSTDMLVNYEPDLKQYAKNVAQQRSLLRDKRNIDNDVELMYTLDSWPKWAKIYNDPNILSYSLKHRPLVKGLRIISEVRCPETEEQEDRLFNNLNYYKKIGYNAALVCFDTTEDLGKLHTTIVRIAAMDIHPIIVYVGGSGRLVSSVFRDPDNIARFIKTLSPTATAILLGHWRTGLHLFLPDKAYTNFIMKTARDANPNIAIIGQAYWGETAESNGEFVTTMDIPTNSSAVLVIGLGYPRAANKRALRKIFPELPKDLHKIGLVVGESPYYNTRQRTYRSNRFNWRLKMTIERMLRSAGCESTLTLSSDGSNYVNHRENLCESPGVR